MRHLLSGCLFMLSFLLGAQTTVAAGDAAMIKEKAQCLGRSVFDVKEDITLHLMNMTWAQGPGEKASGYSPDLRPLQNKFSYGRNPGKGSFHLVSIDVSPETTLDKYDRLAAMNSPSKMVSKERVVQEKIDKISREASVELSYSNREHYEDLLKEKRALIKKRERISNLKIEIVVLNDFIRSFESKGRPTSKFEAELKEVEEEYATYPTDERYANEMAFDFGMPDAFGAISSSELVVLLWRNERIYQFKFHTSSQRSVNEFVSRAHELLSRFRTRDEVEIPEESGFCIPFGFIADDGRAPYSITIAWHPTDNPDLLYSLRLSDDYSEALNLLVIGIKPIVTKSHPALLAISTFGPTLVDIGSRQGVMGGSYFKPETDETQPNVFNERYTITAGHAAKGPEPSIVLEVQNRALTQPKSFEQTKDEFLTMLKSFRLLPGVGQSAAASTPSTHP